MAAQLGSVALAAAQFTILREHKRKRASGHDNGRFHTGTNGTSQDQAKEKAKEAKATKSWIEVKEGEQDRQVDETLAVMRLTGEVYERGADIVQVCEGAIRIMSEHGLRDWLSRRVQFYKLTKNGNQPINVPKDIVQLIRGKNDKRLPVLRGVMSAPTLRPDGSILDKPGYDQKSQLLLIEGELPFVPIITNPAEPTIEYERAFETIWYPFKEFPFVSPYDRAVLVSAILVAVIRPSLRTAPGLAIIANMAASGKTLLAKCLARLMGFPAVALPPVNNEEEMRKRLHSCLRSGDAFILFDNITGMFELGGACKLSHSRGLRRPRSAPAKTKRCRTARFSLPQETTLYFAATSGGALRPAASTHRQTHLKSVISSWTRKMVCRAPAGNRERCAHPTLRLH